MAKNKTAVKVVKDNPKEQPYEVIASAIVNISNAFKAIHKSPLNERAVILLIQEATPGNISRQDIKRVLDAAANLEATYLRKKD